MRLPTTQDVERLIPRQEDFSSRGRGAGLSTRLGVALGVTFGICFLTGLWSHVQYDTPAWLGLGPAPTQLYRFTQGVHVLTGIASIPLILVKLWSVFPRLFIRPRTRPWGRLVLEAAERLSIAALVGSALFLLASGLLNIAQWYPWDFSFRSTHHAAAWVAIGSILVHVGVKLPTIRQELGRRLEDAAGTGAGIGRRTVLRAALASSGLAVLLTAGQTVPLLRKVSVLAVRDGEGPQGLPINRTARAAGVEEQATGDGFRLEVVAGGRSVSLDRDDLLALPQRTHRLPIACVEGWSRSAVWTGVAVRDLLALVGVDEPSDVVVRSLQKRGAFGSSRLPAAFVADHQTLLALELNGETLSLDHGFPCRIIAPNRPGVFQTKWVQQLEVSA